MHRRTIAFVFLVLILFGSALAHPPMRIDLKVDAAQSLLKVVVHHTSNDASKHYIDEVVVHVNGQEMVRQVFFSQTDDQKQEAMYVVIDAKQGDEITVTASCNIFGEKKASIRVPSE